MQKKTQKRKTNSVLVTRIKGTLVTVLMVVAGIVIGNVTKPFQKPDWVVLHKEGNAYKVCNAGLGTAPAKAECVK